MLRLTSRHGKASRASGVHRNLQDAIDERLQDAILEDPGVSHIDDTIGAEEIKTITEKGLLDFTSDEVEEFARNGRFGRLCEDLFKPFGFPGYIYNNSAGASVSSFRPADVGIYVDAVCTIIVKCVATDALFLRCVT